MHADVVARRRGKSVEELVGKKAAAELAEAAVPSPVIPTGTL
jgi:hypothetical protein